MRLKRIVTDEIVKASAGAAYDDLDSPTVEPGHVLQITHVAAENRTSDFTRLAIGIADGITFTTKEAQEDPLANEIYWTNSKILVPAGKKLKARLTGCTSADNLHLAYEGNLWGTEE